MTFPSIVRRSLIINCKARLVSAQRLASLLPGNPGVLYHAGRHERFRVTSQPAAGALSLVLGELCDFNVATFWQKIERYAEGGGDGGLTRATMRAACGLPVEDVALHPDGAGHGVAGVEETMGARQVPGWLLGDEEGLVLCHVSLVKCCLERGWDFCLEHHVSRLHQDVWRRVPARDRVGTLRQLKAIGGVGSLPAYAGRRRTRRTPRKRCRPTLVSPGANASPSPDILSTYRRHPTRRRTTGVAV